VTDMSALVTLSRALHDDMCHSIEWCDGSEHSKTWRSAARAIFSADCAATELHQRVCPAEIDLTFPRGCGEDRERHIDFCAGWLEQRGVL
jgi:hypothetical protein